MTEHRPPQRTQRHYLRAATGPAPHTLSIIVPARELDLTSVDWFDLPVELARLQRPRKLVLDIHAVEFMDSQGLHGIERTAARLRASGIELALRSVRPQPLWLIAFAGLAVPIER